MPDAGSDSFVEDLTLNAEVQTNPLTIPLADVLNWKLALKHIRGINNAEHKYFIVAFRSLRSAHADDQKLYAADASAHAEAKQSGGLLQYWYGALNERRECFAMCLWNSRDEALKALHLPAHTDAMELAREMYDAYKLERYFLRRGADGNPIIEQIGSLPHES